MAKSAHEPERTASAHTLLKSPLLASCAVVAMWLVAASRWIIADAVVPWDSKNQFFAFFRFLAASLHAGDVPFWNPYHYAGHPSVADPQSLIFAPVFFLWALFDGTPSERTFDLLVYAHLLVGGLAVVAIGWRLCWPTAACVLAAAVFMFGGAAAGRLQHTGNILCYALFPLAVLLLQVALARGSVLIGVAFSFVAAALLLARNQVALLLCCALAAIAVGEIVAAPRPLYYLRQRALAVIAMAIVGLALVAGPMLLTLQFAAVSNRPAELLADALKGSYYPLHLAQYAVADIFVADGEFWGPGPWRIPEIAFTDDSFNYMYVGWVPVVLLLWFGVAGGRLWRRGRLLLVAIAILALIYALGRYTPVFAWLFASVPGVDKFRRPVDANFVVGAMLALLVGHLLADYMREGLPRVRALAGLVVALGVLAVMAGAIEFMAASGHGRVSFMTALKTVPIPLGVIAVLACARTPRWRAVAAAAVTLTAVAELLYWNAAFRLNAEARSHYAVLERPNSADTKVLAVLEDALAQDHARGERPRVEVLGMGGPWQNVAVVRGIEAINGYNPLRVGVYDRLVSPGEANWRVDLRSFPPSFDGYDCPLARALGLQYLVLDRPMEQVPQLAASLDADVVLDGPQAWVYRLRHAWPRLKFVTRVSIVDAGALDSGGPLLGDLSPGSAAIDRRTPPAKTYGGAAPGRARITSWRNGRIEIDADSESGGVLVVHEIYYPGWIAEIDGQAVPILRADALFRAVEVPAGHHRVLFRFAPFSLKNLARALRTTLHR